MRSNHRFSMRQAMARREAAVRNC